MKKDRRPQQSESPIERLRIERTNLSQNEFAVRCGIPLRTYQRWISGKTEAKLTPLQWKALMQVLQIQSLDEIPDDFGSLES
ncbi:MAG: helix-turn-helix transcriptional regulator [Symploca sp. SIO2E9]|nr:helix-turn-helix transcriptional regulator [Symploca sp. SIO2E9]